MRIVQNIMQMLLSQAFLHSPYLFQKYRLTNPVDVRYNFNVVALGAWCNGNTWVSKTFVEGSNPSAPASVKSLEALISKGFRLSWQKSGNTRCDKLLLKIDEFFYLFRTFLPKLSLKTVPHFQNRLRLDIIS